MLFPFFAVAGGCSLVFCLAFSSQVDSGLYTLSALIRSRLALAFSPSHCDAEDIPILARLNSSLRAGMSLDYSLDQLIREAEPKRAARLQAILLRKPHADFLSSFLSSALDSGVPLIPTLQSFERSLRARQRLAWKARSLTAQCRAQAEVLSWLPWLLAAAIAVVDPTWFASSAQNPISWLLWAFALSLSGLGRGWLKRSLGRVLGPANLREQLEEEKLPELVLRLQAELAQGRDVETATERALSATGCFYLQQSFEGANPAKAADRLSRLKGVLSHTARTGAPVRDELSGFLTDLQQEVEARWEERVQRLPIVLLAPLFLCFFPSSLCMLGGLLFPLLSGSL